MHRTIIRVIVFFGFGLLLACANSKRQAVVLPVRTISPAAKTADSKPFQSAPLGTLRNVRESESVKVYGVNRYVDPSDPTVLHERHAIYRIEQEPRWVTQSDRNQNGILLGPILGLHNAQYAPEPLPGETARDLVQTKQGLQDANRDIHTIQQNQEKLSTAVQTLAEQTLDAQRKLTTVVSTLNGRLKKLEGNTDEVAEGSGGPSENKLPSRGAVIRSGE
jgi:hypothetical protein